MLGERAEQAFEIAGEARGFLLGIDAFGARGEHGEGDAENLSGFIVAEIANVVGEERQPVHLGEERVDREVDSEGFADLAEACAQPSTRA